MTAIPANDPTNANGVDATQFIQALRAMGEGDATVGCPKWATKKSDPSKMYDDVFVGVTAGTSVCFEVIPAMNTIVKPTMSAQFFHAFINVGVSNCVKTNTTDCDSSAPDTPDPAFGGTFKIDIKSPHADGRLTLSDLGAGNLSSFFDVKLYAGVGFATVRRLIGCKGINPAGQADAALETVDLYAAAQAS